MTHASALPQPEVVIRSAVPTFLVADVANTARWYSIADPAGMMSGLNLPTAPGVEVPVTFLGLAMIVRGAVTSIALGWMIQGKAEGLFLARFTALTILLSAPVGYLKLHRPEFALGDLVQGSLLLVPAVLVKSQSGAPSRRGGNDEGAHTP